MDEKSSLLKYSSTVVVGQPISFGTYIRRLVSYRRIKEDAFQPTS